MRCEVGVPTGGMGDPWNFFIVDVTTREATFIATVPWGGRADADGEYAAWSTDACGYASGSPAVTYVLDRASGVRSSRSTRGCGPSSRPA